MCFFSSGEISVFTEQQAADISETIQAVIENDLPLMGNLLENKNVALVDLPEPQASLAHNNNTELVDDRETLAPQSDGSGTSSRPANDWNNKDLHENSSYNSDDDLE